MQHKIYSNIMEKEQNWCSYRERKGNPVIVADGLRFIIHISRPASEVVEGCFLKVQSPLLHYTAGPCLPEPAKETEVSCLLPHSSVPRV